MSPCRLKGRWPQRKMITLCVGNTGSRTRPERQGVLSEDENIFEKYSPPPFFLCNLKYSVLQKLRICKDIME